MNVIDRLDADWPRLVRSRPMRDALARWGGSDPALRFADVAELLETVHDRGADPAATDRVLAALARQAPADDAAARVLLQALLPGCKSLVRRYFSRDRDEGAAIVVAVAYDRIRTYPFERRPARIAANVLLDVRQRVLRHLSRQPRHARLEPWTHFGATPAPGLCPRRELAGMLRWAVREGVLDEAAVRLIVLTRVVGVPVADLAAAEGTSPQTLRQRRLRAEQRLRAAVAA